VGGLVSFFAPCVIVLVPAFLSHLAGSSLKELEDADEITVKKTKREIIINTIFFIVGFTIIFVALGASLGFLSTFIRDATIWLQRIGGALIILFGLVTLNIIKIPWLQAEHKLEVKRASQDKGRAAKYGGSAIVGAAFAIGWTPCVGPILAGILVLAGTSGSVGSGVLLLLSYTIGLMIPFLITAFFTASVSKFLARHNTFLKWVNWIAGALLIILGILVFTDNFARLVGSLYFLES
jgi:cytochrome c-type biogenesis protein